MTVNAVLSVTLPLVTVSEANSHTHWHKRQQRAKMQRQTVHNWLRFQSAIQPCLPCVVTLTRISPRKLDGDNAVGALKHCRDGVADWLGIDDGDARIQWQYAQRRGGVRQHAVEITLEPAQQ